MFIHWPSFIIGIGAGFVIIAIISATILWWLEGIPEPEDDPKPLDIEL